MWLIGACYMVARLLLTKGTSGTRSAFPGPEDLAMVSGRIAWGGRRGGRRTRGSPCTCHSYTPPGEGKVSNISLGKMIVTY